MGDPLQALLEGALGQQAACQLWFHFHEEIKGRWCEICEKWSWENIFTPFSTASYWKKRRQWIFGCWPGKKQVLYIGPLNPKTTINLCQGLMKVSCSNGFAPGDVVRRRRPCLVGDWKIQFTDVFLLSDATDATLNCKNDFVSSLNAFPKRVRLLFGSLILANLAWKFPVFLIWDVYPGSVCFPSRIQDSGSKFFPTWIPDPRFKFFPSRILDPGCISKNLSILTQKNWFLSSKKYDPGFPSRIQIPDLDADFLPIPDPDPWSQIPNPGIKKAPDPWSRIPDPDSQHWRFRVCSGCRG